MTKLVIEFPGKEGAHVRCFTYNPQRKGMFRDHV